MNQRQRELRLWALEHLYRRGHGHTGRVLSCIDLMEGLFFGEENGRAIFAHDPAVPQHEGRDLFVLSKLEALPALYAVLDMKGYQLPSRLPELPDRRVPGVEVTAELHAYGLCAAVGMAKAIQMERGRQHVFCLMGDYELERGEAWEAVQTAAEEKLDRLCVVLDEHSPRDLQIAERFEAFGWRVIKLRDAHDHDEIVYGYMRARLTQRKPTLIWARTMKSKGVPFAERKSEYDDVVYSEPEMEEIRNILL